MADDLLSVLTEDHQELRGLLSELEVLTGGEHLRRVLTEQLIIEAVRHSVAEECYLYPLCRTRLTDGGALAEEASAEHGQIERILRQLEAGGLPDEHFALLLGWLIGDMRTHLDDEEQRVFPRLAEHVGEDELLALGAKARRSKAAAPTRTAESAGPLLSILLGNGSGLVERVREYLCGRGRAYPRTRPSRLSGEGPWVMTTAIALFTADLRMHDNPVLRGALGAADEVVPLFVRDDGVRDAGFVTPNRAAFLAGCLADLDVSLRARGGRLVIRSGDVVREVCRLAEETGAGRVHVARDVSAYAQRRERRLREALSPRELVVHEDALVVVPPGEIAPFGKHHFGVFTPYFRRWSDVGVRRPLQAPRKIRVPSVASEGLPSAAGLTGGRAPALGKASPELPEGGETEARRRVSAWLAGPIDRYEELHDDLAGDATSRLSAYLHFGCVSPAELVHRARERGGEGAAAFVRQVAWRDFHRQMLADRPAIAGADYRPRGDRWRSADDDADADLAAWRAGRTGYPLVDAAMRQLTTEGWMHNRGRLIAASFLTKTLYVDWRAGARHFLDLLVDGDVANNQLNWQWVAGTGASSRPDQALNPLVQARRFDPRGEYVRRWVPELRAVEGAAVHRPWLLAEDERRRLDYPDPIIDLDEGLARFREGRAG